MFSIDKEEHGFDATFVEEVSDELKCVICCLVLRNPVQIMSCGHRFCHPCFQGMKKHSQQLRIDLICPVDRDVIDAGKVFEDRGIARSVGNLRVKCAYYEQGCTWMDDLRDLQIHEDGCEHRIVKNVNEASVHHGKEDDSNEVMKELLQRVHTCEDKINIKDKDLAHLKFTLKEIKDDSDKKELELQSLKFTNQEMKHQFESEIKILKNRNDQMESTINSIRNDLLKRKKNFTESSRKTLECMIETNNQHMKEKLTLFHEEIESVKNNSNKTQLSALSNDMGEVKSQLSRAEKDMRSLRSHVDKSVNKLTNQFKNIKVEIESRKTDVERSLNETTNKMDELGDRLADVEEYVNDDDDDDDDDDDGDDDGDALSGLMNRVNKIEEGIESRQADVDKSLNEITNKFNSIANRLDEFEGNNYDDDDHDDDDHDDDDDDVDDDVETYPANYYGDDYDDDDGYGYDDYYDGYD